MKCNKKVIIGVTVLILIGVVTISYAFFSIAGKQNLGNTFNSGCLNIKIENESDAITLNGVYPVTDTEGLSTEGYTFTIKNMCSASTNYMINLESLDKTTDTLDTQYIKTALSSDTMDNLIQKLDSSMETKALISSAYVSHNLYKGSIEGNSTREFKLRIWIDYETTKEQGMNKTYKNKINVIADFDLQVEKFAEIKTTYEDRTLEGIIYGEASNIKYCTSTGNKCIPEASTTITNNKIKIGLNRGKNQIICTTLDNERVMCSDPVKRKEATLLTSKYDDSTFLGSDKLRSEFESITTLDNIEAPKNISSWDVSEEKNNGIIAWYTDEDNNGKYELYLAQDGGVVANPDSSYLFMNFNNVKSMDLSNFDTSKVTNMESMFYYTKIDNLNLSSFNTSNVTNMTNMFYGSSNLTSLNLSNFDTSNVTNMSGMFRETFKLTNIDLREANFSKVTKYGDMFLHTNLSSIIINDSNAEAFIKERLNDASETGVNVIIAS